MLQNRVSYHARYPFCRISLSCEIKRLITNDFRKRICRIDAHAETVELIIRKQQQQLSRNRHPFRERPERGIQSALMGLYQSPNIYGVSRE